MNGRKGLAWLGVLPLVVGLTACGGSDTVKNSQPMTLEEVAGTRLAQLSNDEKEGLVYKYVSDRITVDKDRLLNIEQADADKIDVVLKDVDKKLQGGDTEGLATDYANYMLMEFARTPYEWSRAKVEPVGFDPAARLYFVDVTYKTTDTLKTVVPDSKIAEGSPSEETLRKKRYADYINYLTMKQNADPRYTQALAQFEKAWGKLDTVFDEQQGTSLLERTAKLNEPGATVGRLTYSGLVKDSRFVDGAEMTFRLVFKYKFNLGSETDMQVHSVYLKGYHTDGADALLAQQVDKKTLTGLEVLKPFIDKLIVSYHKAVEESNVKGLNDLFVNYGGVDKYYNDLHAYAYNTIGGYSFEILDRRGTDVLVRVNRVNQLRAKGSNMSLPTYDETLIYDLEMSNDDRIRVKSVNLIDSKLVGEPISLIKNVSGISDLIQYSGESFTESNKVQIEEAIKKFSKVVFSGNSNTPEFTSVVDIGVPEATMKKISDFVTAIPDVNRKLTYIVSWNTKTNVYVSLTLREVFETDGGNYDTEAVIDLANRDGEWKVVNYTRTLNIKSAAASASAKNALTEDVK